MAWMVTVPADGICRRPGATAGPCLNPATQKIIDNDGMVRSIECPAHAKATYAEMRRFW